MAYTTQEQEHSTDTPAPHTVSVLDMDFQAFFIERFGKSPIDNGHDFGYADEWVERFNRGTQYGNRYTAAWNSADDETQATMRKHLPQWTPQEASQ